MAEGDVETFDKRGQWLNRVVGENELSTSYSSKDEAIEVGRALAEELGTRHMVLDDAPTGVITDPAPGDEPIDTLHDATVNGVSRGDATVNDASRGDATKRDATDSPEG